MPVGGQQVSIRIGTAGRSDVEKDFVAIGDAGDAQARRYQTSWERASAAVDSALDRQAKAAQRLAAISQTPIQQQIGVSTSTGFGDPNGSARASAAAFAQEMDRGEASAQRLLASVDALYAAQLRYDQGLAEANQLQAQGVIDADRFAQIQAGLKAQLDAATTGLGGFRAASGNARIAQMELMGAARGMTDAIAIGMPIQRAVAIEMGRLTEAAALAGGSLGKIGEYMAGGWGIAIMVGVTALVPLISKLLETGDAVDAETEKLKKQAIQQQASEEAQRHFGDTLEGVTKAVNDNAAALKKLDDQSKTSAQVALQHALAEAEKAQRIRDATVAILKEQEAELKQAQGQQFGAAGGAGAGAAVSEYSQQLEDTQKALDEAQADADEAARQVADATARIYQDAVMSDPVDRIKRHYDDLIKSARERGLEEHKTYQQIAAQTEELKKQRDAEIKAAEARDKKPPANAAGTMAFDDQIARFFDIANKYRGDSEVADKGVLEAFFREAGENLDPQMTAWCAAFVNAVLAAGGVHGTNSFAASSFLDFGKDDIHSPQRGDVVVIRSNGSPSGMHVGFLDSVDNKTGAFTILGGNTANKVGEETVPASSVLAVRRPETPSEAFIADAKSAEEAQKAMDELLKKKVEVTLFSKEELAVQRQITEEERRHQEVLTNATAKQQESLTLTQAEGTLATEDEHTRERKLRLMQQEQDLLRELGPGYSEQVTAIIKAAAAEDKLREQIQQVEATMDELRHTGEDILDTIFNVDNWNNWGDVGKRILHELEQEFITLAALNPLKNLLTGGNLPTLGSLLSGLGAGGWNSTSFNATVASNSAWAASAGTIVGPSGFAGGTDYAPGGWAWVGEEGPELMKMPRGSKVMPAAQSLRMAAANDRGIGAINIHMPIDATGADPAALARLEVALNQMQAELPFRVVTAYYDAVSRNFIR